MVSVISGIHFIQFQGCKPAARSDDYIQGLRAAEAEGLQRIDALQKNWLNLVEQCHDIREVNPPVSVQVKRSDRFVCFYPCHIGRFKDRLALSCRRGTADADKSQRIVALFNEI